MPRRDQRGNNNPSWKGGVTFSKNYWKNRRHKLGLSERYYSGISYTKEYRRLHRQKYKATARYKGELTIKTIQMVYEDNIKKYGTLTCYLCEKPIQFGKDQLEHKIPNVRGGTNKYGNLAIACQKCNSSKGIKTEEEYRKELSCQTLI